MSKEKRMSKSEILKELRGYLFMLLGCVAYGASTSIFLSPNEIVAGGVSGLAVLINILNKKLPVGMVSIALNIPILALGIKILGWRFILRCLITIVTLGIS